MSEEALALHRQGRLAAAERLYDALIGKNHDNFEALHGLGLIKLQRGNPVESLRLIRKAVKQNPNSVEAQGNLGNVLVILERYDEALVHFETALALRPGFAATHNNLGTVLWRLGRQDAALAHFRTALALAPGYAEAHNNLGLVLKDCNRFEEAIEHWTKAEAIRPSYGEAHWNEALGRLALGQYEIGWAKFEWRWLTPVSGVRPRNFTQPLWRGEPLEGRTILLHAEQGLGDTLQFARFVPLVAARGGRVVLEVQPPLAPLLARLDGVAEICRQAAPLPPFAVQCPLMSLPLAFGTRLETIPVTMPYLPVDPARAAVWQQRVAALDGLRVGLVWAGAPRPFQPRAHDVDRRRSITLQHFAPLADVPGVSFISLQKGAPAAQTRTPPAGMVIHDWTETLRDFADTAALIAALDLVISVDTSVVHAAGGLARPVWLLNRYDSCWRWLVGRTDSPWYPTLRQFRQPRPGDWATVMQEVRAALVARVA
ncbi:MAG TPA: tetratricopeptide repeat-containing glycosyltransferase family protein [Stellaceae bacterium]|nr:tetratricopeptide repeat-containing glycosyltransferase family protein [Stellaceae bacterium]